MTCPRTPEGEEGGGGGGGGGGGEREVEIGRPKDSTLGDLRVYIVHVCV